MLPAAARTQRIGVVLVWLAMGALVLSALAAAGLGFRYDLGGLRVSVSNPMRPLVLAAVLGIIGTLLAGVERAATPFQYSHRALSRDAAVIASVFALMIGLTLFERGTRVAGGADASGYVSQSKLWRTGTLPIATPLAHELTLREPQHPFTPVGYRPSGTVGSAVPLYPAGLPLLMAAAQVVGGDGAEFLVVPACAAGLVMVTFFLGRRIGGPEVGLLAAAAIAGSPIMIYQGVQPMSDVPAAFFWTCAIWLLTFESPRLSLLAGLSGAVACMVRPNLLAMAPVLLAASAWSFRRPPRPINRILLFALPVVMAAASLALIQRHLYGGVTTTGYGTVSGLLSVDHVFANLQRYPRWLVSTHSPLLLLALAGPLAVRRGWVDPGIDRSGAERLAWSGLMSFAALFAFYALYLVFQEHEWAYVRFLLPALPWLFVSFAAAAASLFRPVSPVFRGGVAVIAAVFITTAGVGHARSRGAFHLIESERRYIEVAEFVRGLPPDAVVVSLQHSGSIRYYASVSVLRWDWVGSDEIDRAVAELSAKHHPVYAVLDNWEEEQFRARFANTLTVARLERPLFQAGVPTEIIVRVYALAGTPTAASAGPVSSPPQPAPRTPSRQAAQDPAPFLATSHPPRDEAARSSAARH